MEQIPTAASDVVATPEVLTALDIQRNALRDLAKLATECAATEAEIESTYQNALATANKEGDKTAWTVEQRAKSLKLELDHKYADRLAKLAAQQDSERQAVEAAAAASRRKVEHEHHNLDREVKKKYEQAAWLAESVHDGTQAQLREELKNAREQHAARAQDLQGLQNQGATLLSSYGQTVPAAPETPEDTDIVADDAEAAFNNQTALVQQHINALANLSIPRIFVGGKPYLILFLICVVPAGITQIVLGTLDVRPVTGIVLASAFVLCLIAGFILKSIARKQVIAAYRPLDLALRSADLALQTHLENIAKAHEARIAHAAKRRDEEVQAAKSLAAPQLTKAARSLAAALAQFESESARQMARLQEKHDKSRAELEDWQKKTTEELQQRLAREQEKVGIRRQQRDAEIHCHYKEARANLEKRLRDGLASIQTPTESGKLATGAPLDWNASSWKNWNPPTDFPALVRLGDLHVDLKKIADSIPRQGELQLKLPGAFKVPAALAFPKQASLLIKTGRDGRDKSLQVLQMAMMRLLTSLPAGRVRFTIVDPVGLGQSFAGFMHLADHDDALVTGRIWTEREQIEQRLADLTDHMETVIQKYLRNEYETIDQYNAQAGELAEPYRFLVIADFPTSFEGDAYRRLASIAASGARCGVYTLIVCDTREALPRDVPIQELQAASVNLAWDEDHFVWADDVFKNFPLQLDPPASEDVLTDIVHIVGKRAKESKRVELPFQVIAPKTMNEMWTRSTTADLTVPMGRMGATRLQDFRLGRGVAQHALIAGKTGSGKSTLLHVLITNIALWYSPDEVEFYLVDFKKGVEFKTYATHALPHARAIAVESDREFGLSVLQRLDAELTRRGEIFRRVGVQNLGDFRKNQPGVVMPRILLIIDEFQEFFSEDDRLAQDSALLIDRLVRQGRAFGMHVILGSQTIGGTSGLSRATLGQMAVRVALACSETDSQLILGDNNSAARLLSRPGEAIYNDAGGQVEANSPFQITWISDDLRDKYLSDIDTLTDKNKRVRGDVLVFEGNAPTHIEDNKLLNALLATDQWETIPLAAPAWLGDPVAIKDPTAVTFRRQSGANCIMIGQNEEASMSMTMCAMASLAARFTPQAVSFYVLDGTPADSSFAGMLDKIKDAIPHPVRMVEYRAVQESLNEVADELHRRQTLDQSDYGSIFVIIYGLQRYRDLRKTEEAFSLSSSSFGSSEGEEETKKLTPADQAFSEILREGPAVGIHLITWCDTPAAIERTLDRQAMREFDTRILFQMSAADSSNLIDNPAANKLGQNRALVFSEEQGTLEKFRPYALPTPEWIATIKSRLAQKKS